MAVRQPILNRGPAMYFAGLILLSAGLVVLGYQCLEWLRTAEWRPMPISILIDGPISLEWRGAQVIVEWLVDLPLSAALLLAACALIGAGTVIEEARLTPRDR